LDFFGTVDRMPEPGAPRSTLVAPSFEKDDFTPDDVIAVTAMTLLFV
jgi:hypothetical protein